MKRANLIVGAFVVGFCIVCFVGFTAEAHEKLLSIDFSELSK